MCCSLNDRSAISEPDFEQYIGICEQSFFQRYDNKLWTFEPCSEEVTNILRVWKIKSSVDFIKNIHWRRLKL